MKYLFECIFQSISFLNASWMHHQNVIIKLFSCCSFSISLSNLFMVVWKNFPVRVNFKVNKRMKYSFALMLIKYDTFVYGLKLKAVEWYAFAFGGITGIRFTSHWAMTEVEIWYVCWQCVRAVVVKSPMIKCVTQRHSHPITKHIEIGKFLMVIHFNSIKLFLSYLIFLQKKIVFLEMYFISMQGVFSNHRSIGDSYTVCFRRDNSNCKMSKMFFFIIWK